MLAASPPGRDEALDEADDVEAPESEEGDGRRGIASRRHARRRRQLARLTAERMEREQITREYAVLLQVRRSQLLRAACVALTALAHAARTAEACWAP